MWLGWWLGLKGKSSEIWLKVRWTWLVQDANWAGWAKRGWRGSTVAPTWDRSDGRWPLFQSDFGIKYYRWLHHELCTKTSMDPTVALIAMERAVRAKGYSAGNWKSNDPANIIRSVWSSLVISLVNPSPLWNNICASDSQPRADLGKVLRSEVVFPTLTLEKRERGWKVVQSRRLANKWKWGALTFRLFIVFFF